MILRVPTKDWNILSETLIMDMDSSFIEYSLREEISHAFNNVECIGVEDDNDAETATTGDSPD